jgi:hypothetical protein
VSERGFCAVEAAALRAEPDASAEQVTQVLLGEPVEIHKRRGSWARVTTTYD